MKRLLLLTLLLSSCASVNFQATDVRGTNGTNFYGDVTSGSFLDTRDAGLRWHFEVLDRMGARVSGWSTVHLRHGEVVSATCAGFNRFGDCAYWNGFRVSEARARAKK